jgi:hypothetical protein
MLGGQGYLDGTNLTGDVVALEAKLAGDGRVALPSAEEVPDAVAQRQLDRLGGGVGILAGSAPQTGLSGECLRGYWLDSGIHGWILPIMGMPGSSRRLKSRLGAYGHKARRTSPRCPLHGLRRQALLVVRSGDWRLLW